MIETRTAAPLVYPDTESLPVEVRPKTPREVGEHAARYIEEHGWVQVGGPGSPTDGLGVCAMQAVLRGAGCDWPPELDVLMRVIGGKYIGDIYRWNDAPERTEAEVLAALRSIR